MFTFEDLLRLNAQVIQRIMRETDMRDLSLALKKASEPLQKLLLSNISRRAAEAVRDEMNMMGHVKLRDVEAAQVRIIDAVRKLESEGEIDLDESRAGENEIVTPSLCRSSPRRAARDRGCPADAGRPARGRTSVNRGRLDGVKALSEQLCNNDGIARNAPGCRRIAPRRPPPTGQETERIDRPGVGSGEKVVAICPFRATPSKLGARGPDS
jgi:hypothetical protein